MRIVPILLAAALAAGLVACGGPPSSVPGQFGPYADRNPLLRTASGDTFTVYRVKGWRFADGSPPALQLEYAPRGSVKDTLALRRQIRTLWPAFAPYVDSVGLNAAILTATNLTVRRRWLGWVSRANSYGITALRGPDGAWYLRGPAGPPLPPADPAAPPIRNADGTSLTPAALRESVTREPGGGAPNPAK